MGRKIGKEILEDVIFFGKCGEKIFTEYRAMKRKIHGKREKKARIFTELKMNCREKKTREVRGKEGRKIKKLEIPEEKIRKMTRHFIHMVHTRLEGERTV